LVEAHKRKWTAVHKLAATDERQELLLTASVAEAGKVLVGMLKPSDRTITAVRSENDQLVVYDTAALASAQIEVTDDETAESKPKKGRKKKDAAAVSVARPTPSCPQCVPGSIDRAREVLETFLTHEEHAMWAAERHIIVRGQLTGHRYVLAHRHSALACKIGRICYDLDPLPRQQRSSGIRGARSEVGPRASRTVASK
jgi:hypothetical protein